MARSREECVLRTQNCAIARGTRQSESVQAELAMLTSAVEREGKAVIGSERPPAQASHAGTRECGDAVQHGFDGKSAFDGDVENGGSR